MEKNNNLKKHEPTLLYVVLLKKANHLPVVILNLSVPSDVKKCDA